jgi:cysteine synthase A
MKVFDQTEIKSIQDQTHNILKTNINKKEVISMAKIAKQLTELIGHTPLLELTNYEKALGLEAKIIAKLEYFNPLGSVKDRVAAAMIEQGIKDGKINQDTIIIEPTSGNTGIGLAFVAASKGLHLILIMPDSQTAVE